MAPTRAGVVASLACALVLAASDNPPPKQLSTASLAVDGIFPTMTTTAVSGPVRSESGHGALMAWADRLYVLTYLSVPNAGAGTGLYEVDETMTMTLVASHNSTYANRMMHVETNSIIIGPYIIDADRNIRTITGLLHVRVGGMAVHLTNPADKVYMLGMDGPLWEVDVHTLEVTQLFDLVQALVMPVAAGEQQHFKAAYSVGGRLWVASNTFEQADALGLQSGGRLAHWAGPGTNWTIVERTAFVEIAGRSNMGCTLFAVGHDYKSVILKVLDTGCGPDVSYDTAVQTYRLPKASATWEHLWQQEWPRIREVESERYLLDAFGGFYELTPVTWGGASYGIKPISNHLRVVPDFASWRGMLVLGGNQVSSIFDNNIITGQSQAGLWFGKTDDLWRFGKPTGWGGPWLYDAVAPGVPSDPFLMTGFDGKVAHFRAEAGAGAAGNVTITIQIDFTGSAGHRGAHFYLQPWSDFAAVPVAVGGYAHFVFPAGFSAHYVRFVADVACNCTAYLTYT